MKSGAIATGEGHSGGRAGALRQGCGDVRRDDAISHTASNLFVVHSVLHIMEVTGSGSNPSLLPLDIPYAKAVDWLVERRIVAKGSYQKALRTAHAKLEAALEAERPPDETPLEKAAAVATRVRSSSARFRRCSALRF